MPDIRFFTQSEYYSAAFALSCLTWNGTYKEVKDTETTSLENKFLWIGLRDTK